MRRRLPWIIFVSLALLVALGSQFAASYDWPPDEDGSMPVPLLRMPPVISGRPGPVPLEPILLPELTWRFEFRWLGTAPTDEQVRRLLWELAEKELPGFTVQPRPGKSLLRKFRQAPLVPAPGFEFSRTIWPVSSDLSPYETASTDVANPLASGRWSRGEDNIHLDRAMVIVDFHLTGAELLAQLPKVDAFVIAFAQRTNARIKSDERRRQVSVEEFRTRRLDRWSNGTPFAPSYLSLSEENGGGRGRALLAEGGRALALPELYLLVPNGVLNQRARHLLIGALAQRLVEDRVPTAVGVIDVDVHALKHPDMAGWATVALAPGATGKLRLVATELKVKGGRAIALRPEGDAVKALCEFAGCDLTASFSGE